jgi:hypothetical protein
MQRPPGNWVTVKGGDYIWEAEGTFNAATLQLQAKNANGTATNITGATMTANAFLEVTLGADSSCAGSDNWIAHGYSS